MNVLEILVPILGLVFIISFALLIIGFSFLGKKRSARNYRDISAFQRLRRAVGLSVEAGTRLHVSLGRADLTGAEGAAGLAGLSALGRATRAASISDRPPIATSGEGTLAVLSQETIQDIQQTVTAEKGFNPESGRLTGLTPFSFAAGALPIIHDEHVSTNILIGHFGPEVALLTEAADREGSLTIGGSDQVQAQAVLYAAAEEPLIGEEVYASGAYLGAGPAHVASLRTQDIFRWILIGVIILGALARLVGLL